MQQLPDIANLGAVAVIAIFAVKEFFAWLTKKSNGNGNTNGHKVDLAPVNQKLDYLCKVAESSPNAAGQKSSDWWELAFARIVEAVVTRILQTCIPPIVKQCLDEHENKVNRPSMEEATKMRQELLDGQKSLERQIAMVVAEVGRQNRDTLRAIDEKFER